MARDKIVMASQLHPNTQEQTRNNNQTNSLLSIVSPQTSSLFVVPSSTAATITIKKKNMSSKELILFGYDISYKSATFQFSLCVTGLFVCYLFYGILQEHIFSLEGFSFGLYLTFLQFIIYACLCSWQMNRDRVVFVRKAPLPAYAIIAFLSVSTVALSNISCQYLNYPTQVLFKSCKLIPVMLVGVCYLQKKYQTRDYLSVLLLSVGIIIFSLGNTKDGFEFQFKGVSLICCALMVDAIIGNVQEKVLVQYDASTTEMIYYTKMIGLFYILVALLVKGEILPAFQYCLQKPETYFFMMAFSVIGCIGEQFVMAIIKRFGALIAVISTSLRKMLTIIASFLVYPKPFSFAYLIGMILVFAGIGLEIYIKNEQAIIKHVKDWGAQRNNANKLDSVV